MTRKARIGLIGDRNPGVRAHAAIPKALELAAAAAACAVEPVWLPTPALEGPIQEAVGEFDGLWCVPGSPYASMEGALRAIRFARENDRPFLGTCGGFQHALLEYARNVLGLKNADHAEANPEAAVPFISRLACSLVGARGTVTFRRGSRAAVFYGTGEAVEEYHCSFGLNPEYRTQLSGGALTVTGVDDAGEARIVELAGHPFFLATLFQPELSALHGVVHPLIGSFVRAALASRESPRPARALRA